MWEFCTVIGWKYAFWTLLNLQQSGYKSKKYLVHISCFWRTKIVCFTHFKNQFNPMKWKEPLKVKNFEVVNSAIRAICIFVTAKNLAAGRWSDFPPEKLCFEIFPKTNAVVNYFWTKINSWAKFKGKKSIFRPETQWTGFRETPS